MKILIADDDKNIRNHIYSILNEKGYECERAADGEEAVEKYREDNFDCTLLDIDMPNLNGIKAAQEIFKQNPDASIIMITGFDDINTIRTTMRLGAFDYIVKPFEPEELLRILDKIEERNFLLEIKREYRSKLKTKVQEQREKLREMMFNSISSLVKSVEAKDPYYQGHSKEVKEISIRIADEMGFSENEKKIISSASLIHDVGKVGIPDSILLKPAKLTNEEYSKIKKHPEIGADILRPAIDDKRIIQVVKHHHERYDGQGFPDGIKGDEIPSIVRISTVADSISAMTSRRPYRNALDRDYITNELEENSGGQFDPFIAEIALKLINEDKLLKKL